MPFMERLHSAMILKTPMHHPNEAHIVEQPHRNFLDAIRRNDMASVEAQIFGGFDVDFAESAHTPPLIYAILNERFDLIQTLLNHGANVNIRDHRGLTPLHAAVRLRQEETVHLLMRYGADAASRDRHGIAPRELADQVPGHSMAKLLQQTPPMLQEPLSLFEAARRGDLLSIAFADKRNDRLFETDENEQSLLHLTIGSDNLKLVAYLLNKGLDIDAADSRGDTALTLAAHYEGNGSMMRYLIDRHATLNHKNATQRTALMIAMGRGNAPHVELLLDAGADIQTTDGLHTPLTLCHDALEQVEDPDRFRKIESRLLIKGAHVDAWANDLNWTPLMMTVTHPQNRELEGHMDLLLKLGAQVNHADRNGRTALMLACSTGRTAVVRKLIDNYAHPDRIDVFGWSALMFAVYYNHVRLVHMLLEYGADVNASSDKGLTAMKIAKQYDRGAMIDLLIDYGAIAEDENRE
jgi:ankyrin repeat protein